MSATTATRTGPVDERLAEKLLAHQHLIDAHAAHDAARAQLAVQHAATARAQADECDASAAVEAANGNHAFAYTLRAYANGCRQRASEWDLQARRIALIKSPPLQSPERDA